MLAVVAADYYRAKGQVERLFELPEGQAIPVSTPAALLALVNSLNQSTLYEGQSAIIQALRQGIMNMAMENSLKSSLYK